MRLSASLTYDLTKTCAPEPKREKDSHPRCATATSTASKSKVPGHDPGNVRAEAIVVMKELGIDISGHRSKYVNEFQGQSFDYVLTVCDNAKESCPLFGGHSQRIHKAFEDPAALQGTQEERLAFFRRVRDEIRDYLETFPVDV